MLAQPVGAAVEPRFRVLRALRTAASAAPVVLVYLALVAIPFVEVDPWCFAVLGGCFLVIGLAATAGLHRYFSHRSYKTSRAFQLVLAALGCLALQKGPIWWAAKHRAHHRHSDEDRDPHSPVRRGFWYAHMGWLFGPDQLAVDTKLVKDLTRFPELVWLERLWLVPGVLLAAGCYLALGWGGVVVGYVLAVAVIYQVTFLVNSVGHLFGPQRFQTGDASRNNLFVGYLAMGEGWHNNHHRVPYSARHGFAWYEVDFCYGVIWLLSKLGLVWDVKLPPGDLMAGRDTRAVPQEALAPSDPTSEAA
ncbi:MAG: acyl-CoA desaturase [Planctomycetes bacterium]|nr:acyl-CoA desaturase [Planctomycetota bacterium]